MLEFKTNAPAMASLLVLALAPLAHAAPKPFQDPHNAKIIIGEKNADTKGYSLEQFFHLVDSNKDGVIDFDEFKSAYEAGKK